MINQVKMERPPPYSVTDPKPIYVPPGEAPPGPIGFVPPGTTGGQTNVFYTPPLSDTVIVNPEVIVTSLGPNPQCFTCPFCHQLTTSRVESETSSTTHLFAIFMCVFLCWPCCVVPYFIDSCKNQNHYCSNCGAFIGSYNS